MEWVSLGLTCEHCGKDIECKPDYSTGIVLSGFEPMLYRHSHNKNSKCVITNEYKVEPYSSCGVRDKYYKATSSFD